MANLQLYLLPSGQLRVIDSIIPKHNRSHTKFTIDDLINQANQRQECKYEKVIKNLMNIISQLPSLGPPDEIFPILKEYFPSILEILKTD